MESITLIDPESGQIFNVCKRLLTSLGVSLRLPFTRWPLTKEISCLGQGCRWGESSPLFASGRA